MQLTLNMCLIMATFALHIESTSGYHKMVVGHAYTTIIKEIQRLDIIVTRTSDQKPEETFTSTLQW